MRASPPELGPGPQKKEWVVLLLAMLPGFFGFLGIGHLYLGKVWRGLWLLVVGLVVWVLVWALFLLGVSALAFGPRTALILMLSSIGLLAGRTALWIWQTMDARKLYRERS